MLGLTAGSVTAAEVPNQLPPGQGVLCLGTMLYITDDYGQRCVKGRDSEFQARMTSIVHRFDSYILRNSNNNKELLGNFKESQGVGLGEPAEFCVDEDVVMLYESFRKLDAVELDADIDELLARDGPPSFGDCL